MRRYPWLRKLVPSLPVVVVLLLALSATLALAQAPVPNPVVQPSTFGLDVTDLDSTANGPAAGIHGNPIAGRAVYMQDCQACHGLAGIGGFPNPGSDDGTVPPLNPIDPGFVNNDPAVFAKNVDLFLQHGSTPDGEDPALTMPPWGDAKKLTQQQIADVEAYIMQLNGVYWSDRWAPPAQVILRADRSGNTITYRILLVNEGASDMSEVTLRDTLPAGLTYVTSYMPGAGQNPGKWNGTTVEWDTVVPQAGTTGPFFIVATAQGPNVPANVAQASFRWTALDGTGYPTTAVSDPVIAAVPVPQALPPSQAVAPTRAPAAAPTVAATPTAVPTAAPTATAVATTAAGQPTTAPAPTAAPTAEPTTAPAPTAAPTTAPAPPAASGDAAAGAQLVQTRNCTACHTINGAGGKVGPDLSHIATTPYDSLSNDPAFLAQWLANPQVIKPGTIMPNPGLTDTEIQNVVAYLMTLK